MEFSNLPLLLWQSSALFVAVWDTHTRLFLQQTWLSSMHQPMVHGVPTKWAFHSGAPKWFWKSVSSWECCIQSAWFTIMRKRNKTFKERNTTKFYALRRTTQDMVTYGNQNHTSITISTPPTPPVPLKKKKPPAMRINSSRIGPHLTNCLTHPNPGIFFNNQSKTKPMEHSKNYSDSLG